MAPPPPLPPNRPTISILNIQDGETVHQRFLLVYGQTTHHPYDAHATVTVTCRDFSPTTWPCVQQRFKALVHLEPGPNTVTLTTPSSTLAFHVYYLPLLQNPPLQLVIWAAKDSPLAYDVPPQKQHEQGVGVAIEKLRMAGYLWQTFCAEQMHRHGFGRRTFRLEEAWLDDTTDQGNNDKKKKRHTAVVRILRSRQHTMQTIRDARRAQQNPHRDDSVPSLFDLFLEDLKADPDLGHGGCYVAGMILDAHWDPRQQLVLGHAALGGGAGEIRLGMFGSHALHAFPRSLHHLVEAMMNTTPTDTRYVANDANESGNWWKALNVGMGAMLHEVGHMFTLSHTPSGLMARGFNNWNRTFMIQEPGRAEIITPEDEAGSKWHRVDVIRLRNHPSFRLPLDSDHSASAKLAGPSFMPIDSGDALEISSPAGMTMIEVWVNGQYATHFEYLDDYPTVMPMSLATIQQACPITIHPAKDTVKLEVTTPFQQTEVLENMIQFLHDSQVRLPHWPAPVLKGKGCGHQGLGGDKHTPDVVMVHGGDVVGIRAYSGDFLDGIEFIFRQTPSVMLGKKGGHANPIWSLRDGEVITGLAVRCGAWVDGVGFLTNQQRSSPWFGGQGGGLIMAVPPSQHRLIGLYATAGAWMDQIGIYYQ